MLSILLRAIAILPIVSNASISGLAPGTPAAPISTSSIPPLERRRDTSQVLSEVYLLRGGAQYSRRKEKSKSRDEDLEDDEYDEDMDDEEEEVVEDDEEDEIGSDDEGSDVSEGSEGNDEEGGSDYEIASWKSNTAQSQIIPMSSLGFRLFAEAQGTWCALVVMITYHTHLHSQ